VLATIKRRICGGFSGVDRVGRLSNAAGTDHAHPAVAGSYLAACVLYSTLYDKSPEGLLSRIPADSVGIPDDCMIDHDPLIALAAVDFGETDAHFLQRVAWHAVKQLAGN